MNELLNESAAAISRWLEIKLPALSANWWAEHVVNRLTFQEERLVAEKRIQTLSGLDLAAILRVLDQNWSELAGAESLPREARNWVKELQSVRNRWAHASQGGIAATDAFRDADTLIRLLKVVGAGDSLLSRIETFRAGMLAKMAPTSLERKRLAVAS